jgi:ketosteroid isomerase-like protein
MKIRLVVALVGLAISFALPIFAQQKGTADPQIIDQLNALSKKTNEAFNNGDAAALAATFTEDAVLVNDTGPVYGREAIEKYLQTCSRMCISVTISARAISIPLTL